MTDDDRGRDWLKTLQYASLAAAVLALALLIVLVVPPSPLVQSSDKHPVTVDSEQQQLDYNPPESPGMVRMTTMSINETPTVGSPVNVSVWVTHGGNETERVNRTLQLFDREYNVLRDVETVYLQLPPNGSDSATVSLYPPAHSGNFSIGLWTPGNELVMQKDITVRNRTEGSR